MLVEINLIKKNNTKPTLKLTKVTMIGEPAFGKTAGGSVNFNLGDTSEVLETSASLKSVYFKSTFSLVFKILSTILLSKFCFNFNLY